MKVDFMGEQIKEHTDLPLSPPSLPPALLPHDTTEEEGAGPPGGLQQSGVIPAAFRRI